jgi:hypothetical protein
MGRCLLAMIAMLHGACGFDGKSGGGTIDAPRIDGTPGDPDGGMIDAPVIDARVIDARPDAPPSATCEDRADDCAAAGGACNAGSCRIDRNSQDKVTCPDGMPCTVVCNSNDDCKLGVDCAGATTCAVSCTANNACQDFGVDCGDAATCTVTCSGNNACQHGPSGGQSVECRMAATCTVKCESGTSSTCQDGVDGQMAGTCLATCCNGTGCDANDVPGCTFSNVCN